MKKFGYRLGEVRLRPIPHLSDAVPVVRLERLREFARRPPNRETPLADAIVRAYRP